MPEQVTATLGIELGADGAIQQSEVLYKALGKVVSAEDAAVAASKKATEEFTAQAKAARDLAASAATTERAHKSAADGAKANANALDKSAQSTAKHITVANQLAEAEKRLDASFQGLEKSIAAYEGKAATTAVTQAKAAASTDQVEKAMAKLRPGVQALTSQIAGFSSAGTSLLGVLGQMGVGATTTVAVLAGVTAISKVYEKLTEKTREHEKAQKADTEALLKHIEAEKLGSAGRFGAGLDAERDKLGKIGSDLDAAKSLSTSGSGSKAADAAAGDVVRLQRAYDAQLRVIAEGEKSVTGIRNSAAASTLAFLARNNQLVGGQYDEAVRLLKTNQNELAALNQKASGRVGESEQDRERRRDLIEQNKELTAALYPVEKAAKAASAGLKEIDTVGAALAKSLDATDKALHDIFATLAKQNEAKAASDARIKNLGAENGLLSAQITALQQGRGAWEALVVEQEGWAAVAAERARLAKDDITLTQTGVDGIRREVTERARLLKVLQALKDLNGANPFDIPEGKTGTTAAKESTKEATDWANALRSVDDAFGNLASSMGSDAQQAAKAIGLVTNSLKDLAEAQKNAKKAESGDASGGGVRALGLVGIAGGGFSEGYSVGSQTSSKAIGAAGGALKGAGAGATIGSVVPGIGTAVGAVVGAIAGAIGGLLGSAAKGKQAAAQMEQNQSKIQASLEGLRASFGNDTLGVAIAEAKAQFDELRKGTEAAYSGKKNEAERNKVLGELNGLEATRLANLKNEYDAVQEKTQQDLAVRKLIAEGRDDEASAAAFVSAQKREYDEQTKAGASTATLAALAQTQLAEATKYAADQAKKAADEQKRIDRAVFDYSAGTKSFSDPRGATESAFLENQKRRYDDAATAAEKLAIGLYNAAEKADFFAQRALKDATDTASYTARILANRGDTRGAEDITRKSNQANEYDQARRGGTSDANLALLQKAQFSDDSFVQMTRAIEDGTKAINKTRVDQLAAVDAQIKSVQQQAKESAAGFDRQIDQAHKDAAAAAKQFDAQIDAVRAGTKAQLDNLDRDAAYVQASQSYWQEQTSLLSQQVELSKRVVDNLQSVADGLKLGELSTLSPTQKLDEARKQFDALAQKARGGDKDAALGVGGALQELLSQSRNVNASGVGYANDFANGQGVLSALKAQFGGALGSETGALNSAQNNAALAEQTLKSIQEQKDSINAASEKEIERLTGLKDDSAAFYASQIETLGLFKDAAVQGFADQIDALNASKDAINAFADKAIQTLTDSETAANQYRIDTFTTPQPVTFTPPSAPSVGEAAIDYRLVALTAEVAKLQETLITIAANSAATANATNATGSNTVGALSSVNDAVRDVEAALRQTRDRSPSFS